MLSILIRLCYKASDLNLGQFTHPPSSAEQQAKVSCQPAPRSAGEPTWSSASLTSALQALTSSQAWVASPNAPRRGKPVASPFLAWCSLTVPQTGTSDQLAFSGHSRSHVGVHDHLISEAPLPTQRSKANSGFPSQTPFSQDPFLWFCFCFCVFAGPPVCNLRFPK